MKHPLETLLSAAGILLLALLSCLLLPAPSLGLTLARRGGGNYPQALIDFLLVEVAMMLLLGAIALWLRHHLNRQPATVAS